MACSLKCFKIGHFSQLAQKYFSQNQDYHTLPECSVAASINGIEIDVLLDTGSDSCLISKTLMDIIAPTWQDSPAVCGPALGSVAGGIEITFLGCRQLSVQMGKEIVYPTFAIAKGGDVIIIGVDALKTLNITINLKPSGITVTMGKLKLPIERGSRKIFFIRNKTAFKLKPQETQRYRVFSKKLSNSELYVLSAAAGSGILLPSLTQPVDGWGEAVIHNDTSEQVTIEDKEICIRVEQIDKNLNELKSILEINDLMIKNCKPIPYNNPTKHNPLFYDTNNNITIRSCFLSGHMEDQQSADPPETLKELLDLQGISIPKIDFPMEDIKVIIEQSFHEKMAEEDKKFLMKLFLKYTDIIAKHNMDTGVIKDYAGKTIYLDIPLKTPLPPPKKFYNLNPEQEAELRTILQYLVHFGLARDAGETAQTGSPAFLVTRHAPGVADSQLSSRLILDTREVNKYILDCTSTPSEDIFKPLHEILNADWYSSVDFKNAYFSLRVSEDSLATNVTNVYTRERVIQLLVSPMGISTIPRRFNNIVGTQMNLNDKGDYAPLKSMKSWFDDLYLFTKGNKSIHKKELELFFYRIHRLGMKINVKKCEFFKEIQSDEIKILGFTISKGQLVPQKSKISNLIEFPLPTTKTELMKFLGFITFLRPLLAAHVIHLTSILTPLTGSIPFIITDQHRKAFIEIKQILASHCHYVQPHKRGILIIYCDSSERLYGSLAFSYNPYGDENSLQIKVNSDLLAPIQTLDNFSAHCTKYGLKLSYFRESICCADEYLRVFHLLYIASNKFVPVDSIMESKAFTSELFSNIFSNVKKLEGCFGRDRLNSFLKQVVENPFTDEVFYTFITEVLTLFAEILKVNIKLILGTGKVNKTPYVTISNNYYMDFVLGFDQKFVLLFVEEGYSENEYSLKSNYKIDLTRASPEEIQLQFQKQLKSDQA